MKILYLTAVDTVPSEEGQKRIDEALEKENSGIQSIFRDDYGRSREDYEEMNLRIPSYFDDEEKEFYKANPKSGITEEGEIFLNQEELEYSFSDYILRLDHFLDATDDQEIGSIVSTTTGKYIHVEETVEQINLYITYLNLSWFERLKISVSKLFSRKNNK